ncbi:unnamed protein product [Danaus chrysippus]|uniref:(African queen) hypothetical protein n=1 Tax=Danaus chrysippus TaxID=151541 RepID=A0A8J2QKX7_9NEOP|nr:unnamed protein product [Danaus chrysippus]
MVRSPRTGANRYRCGIYKSSAACPPPPRTPPAAVCALACVRALPAPLVRVSVCERARVSGCVRRAAGRT